MGPKRPTSRGEASNRARASSQPSLKKRRADVTARHAANATTDVSVDKTTMNAFCTDEARALPWGSVLYDMNKAVLEAYILANVHAIRMCQLGRPVQPLNQTFFYRCLSSVSVGFAQHQLGDPDFHASVETYKSWRGSDVPFPNSGYICTGWHDNAAKQMATNTQTAVSGNFYQRFHKQIKRMYDMSGKDAYEMLRDVLAPNYDGSDREVLAWRDVIPRKDNGHLDDQAHVLVPLTYKFLTDIETRNVMFRNSDDIETIRSFSLLPTKRGFECSHFKMCSTGLHMILKRAGASVSARRLAWGAVADEWWRRLFNVGKFETAIRTFAGEIVTDGVSVSILLRKPKRDAISRPLDGKCFDVMWGLDSRRRDMFVATNQAGETVRCSTREFYNDAMYMKSNRTIKTWQEPQPAIVEAIRAMPSKKTASLDLLEAYVRYMIPCMDLLLTFAMVKSFRKLKLRRFIFAQKKLRALCLLLTRHAGTRTVVGFGKWSNTDPRSKIKRAPAGPVKKLERELRKHCVVVSIDEFRTSQLHAECHHQLTNQCSLRML